MIRLRPLWLVLMLCLALPVPAPRAQEEGADAQAREADERATSVEARQSALKALLDEASRLRSSGESLAAARALNRAGRFHLKLSLQQDALATYREALRLTRQTPDAFTNVDSLNGLGLTFYEMSECGKAQAHLQKAIALSEEHGYLAGKAEALLTLSSCQNYGDHALALRTAQEGLALWQTIGNKRGIADAYSSVGHYHLAQNNLAESTQSFEAALGLWRELNVANEQAVALINLGFIEYRRGAWQSVFTYLAQAQELLDEKAEPYKMGQITSGLAEAFIESGSPETGLKKYLQALDYYRETKIPRAVIATIWGVGRTHYILGNYAEARSNLQRALADAESIQEPTIMAMCHDMLGQTFGAMNDPVAALRHFDIAIRLYTKAGNSMEVARVRALKGQVFERQARIEEAREDYRKALETFRGISDDVNQSATLYALGSLELRQNNLDLAEDYLRRSIEVTENMRRVSTSRDLTTAFSATVHERYESYVECLMRRHGAEPARGLEARAFETSELVRARSLAELLRATETDIAPGLDPRLAAQEKSLRQTLRAKTDYKVELLSGAYKKEELVALEAELSRLEAEYKQVNENIRARHPSYGQITRPIAWDLRRIQEQVIADDETLLLEYSLGAEKSYVWAVTRDRITSHEVPSRQLVGEAAQRVYKLLATQPGAQTDVELTRAAHELSRMILAPVADSLSKRRIIVVADGALNYIPFQFLPSPTDNEPLVAAREIVNAPSASILGQLRQETERRAAPSKTLAAFGDPVFASDYAQREGADGDAEEIASAQARGGERWRHALRDLELNGDSFDPTVIGRLFYAKRELANLRSVAGGQGSLVAADYDATRERLRSTDLTQFSILHFATHGFLDPVRPENSGLMLSTVDQEGRVQEGFVGLQEIYTLRAPVDLVVLSACRTALGKEVRGEGLIGLTRGFMYAGASSVVSSLWKVDDEATAELMKRFYANMLEQGMTPASALRAAQNSIRQEPQWRSPYYWAAFTFQGEHRRVINPASASPSPLRVKLFALAALLALLACVVWLYRRVRLARAAR